MSRKTQNNSFANRVRAVVKNISKGTTMTYGQVASRAGNIKAARAVGTIMKNNFDATIPCHRVIRSDGTIGDYNRGGRIAKRILLQKEGVLL